MKDFALEPGTNNFLWKKRGMTMTSEYLQYMQQKVICCLSLLRVSGISIHGLAFLIFRDGVLKKTATAQFLKVLFV